MELKMDFLLEECGIIDKDMPIHISNLMFYDTVSKKGVKVGYNIVDNKKVRIIKSTGKEIKWADY